MTDLPVKFGGRKLLLASLISVTMLSGCGGSDSDSGNGGGSDVETPEPPASGVQPSLSLKGGVVFEGHREKTVTFAVNLSEKADQKVSFTWETVSDTAQSGSDFVASKGIVEVPAGESSASIDVQVLGDKSYEPDESFKIKLSNPDGAKIDRDNAEVSVALMNDDEKTRCFLSGQFAAGSGEPGQCPGNNRLERA